MPKCKNCGIEIDEVHLDMHIQNCLDNIRLTRHMKIKGFKFSLFIIISMIFIIDYLAYPN